jgi:hypothetical protein
MRLIHFIVLSVFGAFLVACGGGASKPVETSAVETGPVIRFIGTFELACTGCSPARDNILTIGPNTGATTLGSRDIAKIELSVDQGPVQTLTAPNVTTASGQPNWVFRFPQTTPIVTDLSHICSPQLSMEITVTDVGGFAFKKYFSSCRSSEVFNAFSDYGDKTVTINASSSAPTRASFRRSGSGGYVDAGTKSISATTTTWSLKARGADAVSAGGLFDNSLADGSVVSVSMEDGDGSLASSSVVKNTGPVAEAFLLCCGVGTSTAPSAGPRTISFAVAPAKYNVPVSLPDRFNVYYRVFDPTTNTVVSEFRGTGAGYTAWPVQVVAGYELRLEASPVEAGTYVQLYVTNGIDSPYTGNSLGMAQSNRTDVPARVIVFAQ